VLKEKQKKTDEKPMTQTWFKSKINPPRIVRFR